MSILRGLWSPKAVTDEVPRRSPRRRGVATVAPDEALRHSVVWACLRLRADLISTSPVDCYRAVGGRKVAVATPPVLVTPDGRCDVTEWLYSTQMDLDRMGNCFGLITARDGLGLPARIELLDASKVTVRLDGRRIVEFRVDGEVFPPEAIWHERQFTIPGCPLGLSPIGYAALSLSVGLSAREFAADWFAGKAVPSMHLRNSTQTLDAAAAEKVKQRFVSSVAAGDPFVSGSDWELKMLSATASESAFIDSMNASASDICRFLGVPADMVDVDERSGSVTYANIVQRNLQLLIMNLGPAVTRRERALSTLLARPRFVKLNTDAVVLRMDPMARAEMNRVLLESRQRTPSEVREKDDLPPFTPEQVAEIQAVAAKVSPRPTVKE